VDACCRGGEVPVGEMTFGATRNKDSMEASTTRQFFEHKEEEPDTQQASFLLTRGKTHYFVGRISNTRAVWLRDTLVSRSPCGAHARAWIGFLCRWLDDIASMCLLYDTRQNMRYIQHRKPGSRADSENSTRLSLPSDRSRPIVGCHSKHLTSHP